MIPPGIFDIAIKDGSGKGFRIWFPFFLFWPFLIALVLILMPLAAVTQLFLATTGIKPFSILFALVELFGSMRGMSVVVYSKKVDKSSSVKVKFI